MPDVPQPRRRFGRLLLLLAVCVAVGGGAYLLLGRADGAEADCERLGADQRVEEALGTGEDPRTDCAGLGAAILSATGGGTAEPRTEDQAAAMKGVLLAVADDVAGREDHAVPDGLRRPLGTALQGHALDVYENLNALDFVYSNASAPSAAVWKDGKGYHFAVAQQPVIRVIRAVSDDPAVYAGLRTALTAEGAGRLAAVPGDATGASLTAGPAVFARVMGTLDGIAAHTAGSGEPGTKWYAAVVAALSQDGATAADPTADVAGHLTGTWRQRLRTLPGKETGAGALTGQCEEFFTTWADLKDVPEAEREPALRSCRSGAWTTSQRALKDLGD